MKTTTFLLLLSLLTSVLSLPSESILRIGKCKKIEQRELLRLVEEIDKPKKLENDIERLLRTKVAGADIGPKDVEMFRKVLKEKGMMEFLQEISKLSDDSFDTTTHKPITDIEEKLHNSKNPVHSLLLSLLKIKENIKNKYSDKKEEATEKIKPDNFSIQSSEECKNKTSDVSEGNDQFKPIYLFPVEDDEEVKDKTMHLFPVENNANSTITSETSVIENSTITQNGFDHGIEDKNSGFENQNFVLEDTTINFDDKSSGFEEQNLGLADKHSGIDEKVLKIEDKGSGDESSEIEDRSSDENSKIEDNKSEVKDEGIKLPTHDDFKVIENIKPFVVKKEENENNATEDINTEIINTHDDKTNVDKKIEEIKIEEIYPEQNDINTQIEDSFQEIENKINFDNETINTKHDQNANDTIKTLEILENNEKFFDNNIKKNEFNSISDKTTTIEDDDDLDFILHEETNDISNEENLEDATSEAGEIEGNKEDIDGKKLKHRDHHLIEFMYEDGHEAVKDNNKRHHHDVLINESKYDSADYETYGNEDSDEDYGDDEVGEKRDEEFDYEHHESEESPEASDQYGNLIDHDEEVHEDEKRHDEFEYEHHESEESPEASDQYENGEEVHEDDEEHEDYAGEYEEENEEYEDKNDMKKNSIEEYISSESDEGGDSMEYYKKIRFQEQYLSNYHTIDVDSDETIDKIDDKNEETKPPVDYHIQHVDYFDNEINHDEEYEIKKKSGHKKNKKKTDDYKKKKEEKSVDGRKKNKKNKKHKKSKEPTEDPELRRLYEQLMKNNEDIRYLQKGEDERSEEYEGGKYSDVQEIKYDYKNGESDENNFVNLPGEYVITYDEKPDEETLREHLGDEDGSYLTFRNGFYETFMSRPAGPADPASSQEDANEIKKSRKKRKKSHIS